MFGALYGDILGSYYEVHSTKDYEFPFVRESTFTDDSVLTAAVCKAILSNPADITRFGQRSRATEYAAHYRQYYARFPHAGFGVMFSGWATAPAMTCVRSFGNGAAMRVVPIAYAYSSLEQIRLQVAASCRYTHRHPEAVRGAQAVAASVFLARSGKTKDEIRHYVRHRCGYPLTAMLASLRADYRFDSRTSYSVPPAIEAFLESEDYESAVRGAISLGGDADTMACIAGGIAEAYYREIPDAIATFCDRRLDAGLRRVVRDFAARYEK